MRLTLVIVFVSVFGWTWGASIIAPQKVPAPTYGGGAQQTYYKPKGLHQYAHVKHPGVFEWGYNRGMPQAHIRSQVFDQAGHIFSSAVSIQHYNMLIGMYAQKFRCKKHIIIYNF